MADISIKKLNESFVEIAAQEDIMFNIYSRYSEYVAGYQFQPRYKLHAWDGKHHAFNMRTGILPIGLMKDLLLWCKSQGNLFELEGFRDDEFLEEIDETKYQEQIKDNMKNAPFEIRDYQDRAVRAALKYHKRNTALLYI